MQQHYSFQPNSSTSKLSKIHTSGHINKKGKLKRKIPLAKHKRKIPLARHQTTIKSIKQLKQEKAAAAASASAVSPLPPAAPRNVDQSPNVDTKKKSSCHS